MALSYLQAIAEAQSGTYYYVASATDIPTAFGDALGGMLSVVAKSVKLKLRPQGGAALTSCQAGGTVAQEQGGMMATVVLPDLFAEETKDVLVTLQLPASTQIPPAAASSSAAVVALAEVEYVDPATGVTHQLTQQVTLPLAAEASGPAPRRPHSLVAVTRARYYTAEVSCVCVCVRACLKLSTHLITNACYI